MSAQIDFRQRQGETADDWLERLTAIMDEATRLMRSDDYRRREGETAEDRTARHVASGNPILTFFAQGENWLPFGKAVAHAKKLAAEAPKRLLREAKAAYQRLAPEGRRKFRAWVDQAEGK
jgi:hypothetical protein